MMNTHKQPLGIHPGINHGTYGRYSPPYRPPDPMRRMGNCHSGNIFGGLDDSLLARAEALAAADMTKNSPPGLMKPESLYGPTDMNHHNSMSGPRTQMPLHGFPSPSDTMLDQNFAPASMSLTSMSMSEQHMHMANHSSATPSHHQMYPPTYTHPNMVNHNHHLANHNQGPHSAMHEQDCDPRELEAFAERFKQRRIKLGVTQADVGGALGKLKLPGVGSLSQSTICRFESLTLSHNNMVALKPILQAWLEQAEKEARERKENAEMMGINGDKKRKRTSIAAPEKRSLEAYFAIQPRPSGEKIAQIAEKLDLKKNVVRVWFCNQRQKQKRMKFAAMQRH